VVERRVRAAETAQGGARFRHAGARRTVGTAREDEPKTAKPLGCSAVAAFLPHRRNDCYPTPPQQYFLRSESVNVRAVLVGCGVLFAVIGCNKSEDGGSNAPKAEASRDAGGTASSPVEAPPAKATKPWDASKGTATITGVVKYVGKAPKRRPVDMGGKAECAAHQTEPALDESIIVNADGQMKNVFVYVRKGAEEWIFPVPTEPVVLSQKGCTFHPHVVGVRVGQPLSVRNNDPCSHNVHCTPRNTMNSSFNFTQTAQAKEDTRQFAAREVFVRIGCDIHGWMRANIAVVDNPFFAITGDDGKFELKNLPPGEYQIEAVQEELGRKSQTVKVGDKESKTISFEFSKKKEE
jgi:plastocyanin